MAWICRLLENEPQVRYPGDMWYAPEMITGVRGQNAIEQQLSDGYIYNTMPKRAPLMLVAPDLTVICLDGRFEKYDMQGHRVRDGYMVYGNAPKVTVVPHIETDGYRGSLTNGILGNDFDGRTYE